VVYQPQGASPRLEAWYPLQPGASALRLIHQPPHAKTMTQIDTKHYHGWHGELRSPWFACGTIVRLALLQVFRRKLYWVVLAVGLAQFLLYWSVIYAVTQLQLPQDVQGRILTQFGFSAEADLAQDNGYMRFMERQNVVVMILLAFSGSLLVGADFRERTLPFYLSRRIDRRHYILGKLLAIGVLVSLLTTVPALLLFLEYGMFTSSTDYWLSNGRVVLAVVAYGTIISAVNSLWLTAMSAYLQRAAPIAIAWCSLLFLPGRFGDYLRSARNNQYWRLMDLWRDMRLAGRLCFEKFRDEDERMMAWWAAAVLASGCVIALVALVRRVRGVEVVE
jgi:ABC-2 type transport system permease protein